MAGVNATALLVTGRRIVLAALLVSCRGSTPPAEGVATPPTQTHVDPVADAPSAEIDAGVAAAAEPDATPGGAPAPPPVAELPTLVPEHAGFVGKPASEATCASRERAARTKLDALAGPCRTAEDCAFARSACPFGCWAVVSQRADDLEARKAVDRYFRDCSVCKNKCTPRPTALACVDGACTPG